MIWRYNGQWLILWFTYINMKIINSQNAPKAIWPYSQAVISWNLLFCSGQIGLNPSTMELEIWINNQTEQVCKNIWAVLWEAWLSYENVFKTTIYLSNIWDFSLVNEIYVQYFAHKPARSTVEVSNLPKWALVEIEVIAEFNLLV